MTKEEIDLEYYVAVRNRDFKKTKEMIDKGEIKVTNLWDAIKSGNLDVVKRFIGEFNRDDIDSFKLAIAMGNLEVIKLLVANGAVICDVYNVMDFLALAAEYNYISVLKYILEQGQGVIGGLDLDIKFAMSRA